MKLKGRNKINPKFSISSMTDIVFSLLVFFMITASSPNALDLLLPKAKGKSTNTQNVSIGINKNLNYLIDKRPISITNLDSELRSALNGVENPTIISRVEESVPIENTVNIMDIASQNQYKVILAVRPKQMKNYELIRYHT